MIVFSFRNLEHVTHKNASMKPRISGNDKNCGILAVLYGGIHIFII